MDGQNGDALFVRGRSQNRNKNNVSSGRSKSRGRSKSPGKPIKVCSKCGKEGHFKKECRSKAPEKGNGFDDTPFAKVKTTSDEFGDVYLASSSSAHIYHAAWLIDSCASLHFTPLGSGSVNMQNMMAVMSS